MEVYQRVAPSLFTTWIVLGCVAIFLFIGLLNNDRDLILLTVVVLALMGSLRLWATLSTLETRFELTADRTRMFAGEGMRFTVEAQNAKALPISLDIYLPVHPSLQEQRGHHLHRETSMASFQQAFFTWELKAGRRGVFPVGPLKSASGDMLGFFFSDHNHHEQIFDIIVYPRLVPLGPLDLPRRDFFGIPGGESLVDDPVYILGTRDYHNGIPARFIHWKASARYHRLQQKVFEPTDQEKVLLVLDADGYAGENQAVAFEQTLEVVASLAVRLDRQGCALGFLTNAIVKGASPVVPIGRNPAHVVTLLETLARAASERRQALAEMMASVDIPWGVSCVYFARQPSAAADLVKAQFRRKRIPVVFLPFERIERLRCEETSGKRAEAIS